MKTIRFTQLFTLIALALTTTSYSGTPTSKSIEADKNDATKSEIAQMITKGNKAHQEPEVEQIMQLGSDELIASITAYGQAEYQALYPEIVRLEATFNETPNQQTKAALISFLKEHKLFGQILKQTPKELYDKALEKKMLIPEYLGTETDYAKIEAYYDRVIQSHNGDGNTVTATAVIKFD